jgi:hypothetical protein
MPTVTSTLTVDSKPLLASRTQKENDAEQDRAKFKIIGQAFTPDHKGWSADPSYDSVYRFITNIKAMRSKYRC